MPPKRKAATGEAAPPKKKAAPLKKAKAPTTAVEKIVASIRDGREVVQAPDGKHRFEPVSRVKITKALADNYGLAHKASVKRAFEQAEQGGVLAKVKASYLVAGDDAGDHEPDRVEEEEPPYIPSDFQGLRPYILIAGDDDINSGKKAPVSEAQWAEWLDDADCFGAEHGGCEPRDRLDLSGDGCYRHSNRGGGWYDMEQDRLREAGECPDCYLAEKMREYCSAPREKAELLEKIEKVEHKLAKAKQEGDAGDVDKYSRKLSERRAALASLGTPVTLESDDEEDTLDIRWRAARRALADAGESKRWKELVRPGELPADICGDWDCFRYCRTVRCVKIHRQTSERFKLLIESVEKDVRDGVLTKKPWPCDRSESEEEEDSDDAGEAPEPAEQWRDAGSDLLGLALIRPIDEDGALVNATVVSWLPASESDFFDDDEEPAALYKIRYLDGALAGDHEDLEAHEVQESRIDDIPLTRLQLLSRAFGVWQRGLPEPCYFRVTVFR